MVTEQNREIQEEKRYNVAGDEQSEVGESYQNLPMEMEYDRDFSAQREGTPVFHFTESQATPVVHFTESETHEEEDHSLSIESSRFEEMMMTLHHSAPPPITPAITHLQMEEENNNYRQGTKLPSSDPLLEAMLMERDSFERTHYSHVSKSIPASLGQKTLAHKPPTKSLEKKVDAVYREVIELREELSEKHTYVDQTMKVLKYEVLAMKVALRRQLTDSTAVKLLQTEEGREEEPAKQSDEEEDSEEENEDCLWRQKRKRREENEEFLWSHFKADGL